MITDNQTSVIFPSVLHTSEVIINLDMAALILLQVHDKIKILFLCAL